MDKTKKINYRWIFFAFLAFLFGIVMARKLYVNADTMTIVTVLVAFVMFIALMIFYRKFLTILLVLAFFFFGNGCFFLSYHLYVGRDYSGPCAIVGRISDDLEFEKGTFSGVLEDCSINGEAVKNITFSILGCEDDYLKPGDQIAYESTVSRVKLFELGSFNNWIRDDVLYQSEAYCSQVTVVGYHLNFDESFRLKIKNMLFENMSEEGAGVCYAMLFGDKSQVGDEIKIAVTGAGVIHLLTVSGLHVGFLLGFVLAILKLFKLRRLSSTIIATIFLMLYNILCGFTPSIMRASIMAVVMMLARLSGREYDGLTALSVSGFITLFIQPLFAYDLGFLMSYFCVMSIFMLHKPLSKFLGRFLNYRIAGYISLSISAQIGVLPFIAEMYRGVNLLSFFANLIIVPIFSFLYPLLFLIILLSLILPLAKALVLFDFALTGIVYISKFFSLTIGIVYLKPFVPLLSLSIFSIIFVISRYFMVKTSNKCLILCFLSILLAVSAVLSVYPLPSTRDAFTIKTNFSNAVILQSKTQTLIVNDSFRNYDIDDYLYRNKIYLDYAVEFEMPSSKQVDYYHEKGVDKVITFSGESDKFVSVVEGEQTFGDFKISYQNELGLDMIKIIFDDVWFCFARNQDLSYNKDEIQDYIISNGFDLFVLDEWYVYRSNGGIISKLTNENLSFKFDDFCTVRGID